MKRLFLGILITVFALNSVLISAWAAPCEILPKASETIMSADMPCHEDMTGQAEQKSFKHCEGICLCLDMALSHAQIITPSDNSISFFALARETFPIKHETATALLNAPPKQPPKLFS